MELTFTLKTKTTQNQLKLKKMNAKQRKELQGYADSLDEIKCAIEEMQETEQDKLDNMPESLQESERGEAMQFAIDQLDEASTYLQDSIDAINEILEG